MKTIMLEIEDSKFEQFMGMINLLKSDVVKHFEVQKDDAKIQSVDLENDPLAQELKRRIQEIEDETAVLTPFQDGMDSMMERIRLKYASA